MVRRAISLTAAVQLAALVLSAAEGPAGATDWAHRPAVGLGQADLAVSESLREGHLERRLRLLEQRLLEAAAGLIELREDALRLRQRADSARLRRERDGFFPFDIERLRDGVWRRKQEMTQRLREAESLAAALPADGRLARKAARVRRAAVALRERLQGFEAAALELETAVKAADGALLGARASWYAAMVRAESREAGASLEHVIDAFKE